MDAQGLALTDKGIIKTAWQACSIDLEWMQSALELAKHAAASDEVPIGAVVVSDGVVIGKGHNSPVFDHDPTSHAEMHAIRQAASKIANYRLTDSTLYVTLMPCVMCWGAIKHARISRVVVGCENSRYSPTWAILESLFEGNDNKAWSPCQLHVGCLQGDSEALLADYFRGKRPSREQSVSKLSRLTDLPNINSYLADWLAKRGIKSGDDLLRGGLGATADALLADPSFQLLPDKEKAMLMAVCHYLQGNPMISWRNFLEHDLESNQTFLKK